MQAQNINHFAMLLKQAARDPALGYNELNERLDDIVQDNVMNQDEATQAAAQSYSNWLDSSRNSCPNGVCNKRCLTSSVTSWISTSGVKPALP